MNSEGRGRAVSSFDPEPSVPKRRRTRRSNSEAHASGVERPSTPPFDRIIRLCAQRDRSQHELLERLVRAGYTQEESQSAVDRAVACGLVSDSRFAEAYIRSRVSMGKGRVAIERELQRKFGIDPAPFFEDEGASYGLSEDEQTQRAVAFLLKHEPRCKDVWGGAYRKLIAKGYAPSVASRATREWFESRD